MSIIRLTCLISSLVPDSGDLFLQLYTQRQYKRAKRNDSLEIIKALQTKVILV